jgi:hypothetical protein
VAYHSAHWRWVDCGPGGGSAIQIIGGMAHGAVGLGVGAPGAGVAGGSDLGDGGSWEGIEARLHGFRVAVEHGGGDSVGSALYRPVQDKSWIESGCGIIGHASTRQPVLVCSWTSTDATDPHFFLASRIISKARFSQVGGFFITSFSNRWS